jgi:hypothetical protein
MTFNDEGIAEVSELRGRVYTVRGDLKRRHTGSEQSSLSVGVSFNGGAVIATKNNFTCRHNFPGLSVSLFFLPVVTCFLLWISVYVLQLTTLRVTRNIGLCRRMTG